ncbi:MAG: 3-hydroxyacyl-ACP dehydratase FabZ [Gammaproteobacteria bacterium]
MTETIMDIEKIMSLLPHRYPFLLVDRVVECTPGESLVAIKNVTINEPYFEGHFPHLPVMPGVLIIEALAQACGLLAFATKEQGPDEDTTFLLVSVDKARFRRPVVPGDQLKLTVTFDRVIRGLWRFAGVAEVDGAKATSVEIMVAPRAGNK